MISLGILTVRKDKIGFWIKMRRMVRVKERFCTQAEFVVAELAWTEQELRRLPAWFRQWLYRKGRSFLLRQHCQKVALDAVAEKALFSISIDASGFYLPIPVDKFRRCILEIIPKSPGRVYIKTSKIRESEELLDALCPRCNALFLCTDDCLNAKKLAERICNIYGFYPEIREKDFSIPFRGWWIDLEAGALGIGKEVIADSMEMMLDLHRYAIAQEHYWSGVDLPTSKLSFVSWCKGKKRLTSS